MLATQYERAIGHIASFGLVQQNAIDIELCLRITLYKRSESPPKSGGISRGNAQQENSIHPCRCDSDEFIPILQLDTRDPAKGRRDTQDAFARARRFARTACDLLQPNFRVNL